MGDGAGSWAGGPRPGWLGEQPRPWGLVRAAMLAGRRRHRPADGEVGAEREGAMDWTDSPIDSEQSRPRAAGAPVEELPVWPAQEAAGARSGCRQCVQLGAVLDGHQALGPAGRPGLCEEAGQHLRAVGQVVSPLTAACRPTWKRTAPPVGLRWMRCCLTGLSSQARESTAGLLARMSMTKLGVAATHGARSVVGPPGSGLAAAPTIQNRLVTDRKVILSLVSRRRLDRVRTKVQSRS